MSEWTEGYVTEIEYTHGYYRELSPVLQRFALLFAGFAPPPADGAYLELGYGQGVSFAIHAAATPSPMWGTDFNPSHATHAGSLLKAAGIEAYPFDASFAEFAQRRDLPDFHYAGLHGVWSWVSDENRAHIVSVLRQHLVPGAGVYISYNSLPGWSASLSLRDLLTLHAETAGAESQGIAGRIDAAVAFAQQLADKGAAYFRQNPAAVSKLKLISEQRRDYVAHEYFNRDWNPMPFAALAEWMAGAKLEFASSVNVVDNMEAISLTPEAREVMQGITHPILRESVRDFFVNQQFRRDIFTRGARRLSQLERAEALTATRVILTAPAENIPFTVNGPFGEIKLQEAIYRPILDLFVKNGYRAMTIGEIAAASPQISLAHVIEASSVLVGAGLANPAQDEATVERVRPKCRALNRELLRRARGSEDVRFLASPVSGGAFAAHRIQQLFLLARAEGKKSPEEWGEATWRVLESQNQRFLHEGKALETPEENVAELTSTARTFANSYLPLLVAAGVAD